VDVENLKPVCCGVCEVVGRGFGEGVGFKAEGAADAASTAVAGGEDVGVGVADHDGFGGSDGMAGDGCGFGDEGFEAVRIGLFGVEAVAAVVLKKEGCDAEVGADIAGRIDRLVGQDGHEGFGAVGADRGERFEDTRVEEGVVELVDAVVVEEECKRLGYIFFVVNIAFGVAKGSADEERGSVADVAGDDGFGQL